MFDAKYSISYLQFVRVSYEEAGKTISYFTHVDAHFTSRFFDQFFRAKKKRRKSIDCISFFFFRSSYIKKKRNKRIEISTPSSRYLLQKQVQSCDRSIQPEHSILWNEYYRNEIALRMHEMHTYIYKIFIRYWKILFYYSNKLNKIQRRKQKNFSIRKIDDQYKYKLFTAFFACFMNQ